MIKILDKYKTFLTNKTYKNKTTKRDCKLLTL